jgi:hypothetical protein
MRVSITSLVLLKAWRLMGCALAIFMFFSEARRPIIFIAAWALRSACPTFIIQSWLASRSTITGSIEATRPLFRTRALLIVAGSG